jgi:uncharacterized cupin superfamily protein
MMYADKDIVFVRGGDVEMKPCPVNPAWVIEGSPVARNFVLSRSADTSATALLWDCTEGVFNWHYDIDETVYVLEGQAIVTDDTGAVRIIAAGDHVLFRAGSHAVWRVEKYVRKVAFCRSPVPTPLMFAARVMRKLAKIAGLGARQSDAPAMFGG